MIRLSIACDVCKKDGLHVHHTNLPKNGMVEAPPVTGNIWWIRVREGDGSHREVHWHFCTEKCLATWAAEQAKARTQMPS